MKPSRVLFAMCCVFLVSTGTFAVEVNDLEADLATAKAAYLAAPSSENLAEVDRLSALLVAEYGIVAKAIRAEVTESEPNDDSTTADPLQTGINGDYGVGDISAAGDIDWWSAATPPSNLAFAYVATSDSTTGGDSQLNVYDNDGTTLVEFDDDDGPGLSSVVAGALVGPGPSLFYRINEFLDDGEITPYYLFQAVIARTAFDNEVEPNDDFSTATAFTSQGMAGDFSPNGPDSEDWYSISLGVGDIMAAILDGDPDDAGYAGTKQLEIYDTDGTTLLADETQDWSTQAYAAGPITAAAAGTYFVRVTSDTESEDYRVVVVIDGGTIPVEILSFTVD